MEKSDYLSHCLRDMRRNLEAHLASTGHLYMGGDELARFAARIGAMSDYAREIENALSQAEWNRRALADQMRLLAEVNDLAAEVLQLMRPAARTSNVVPFRPRPARSIGPATPPGGNAA